MKSYLSLVLTLALFAFVFWMPAVCCPLNKETKTSPLTYGRCSNLESQKGKFVQVTRSSCYTYQCNKKRMKERVKFECAETGGLCYPIGSTWKNGCTTFKCDSHGIKQFETPGCRDHSGGCKKLNESWRIKCANYRCMMDENYPSTKLISGGCLMDGRCHDFDSEWNSNCMTFTCKLIYTDLYSDSLPEPKRDLTGVECIDSDANCRKHGEEIEFDNLTHYGIDCTCHVYSKVYFTHKCKRYVNKWD